MKNYFIILLKILIIIKTKIKDMKTEIVTTQGKSKIVLKPENEFEIDLIEKIVDSKIGYNTSTDIETHCIYSSHSKHRIEINLIEKTK
jgi:hypothetical protein